MSTPVSEATGAVASYAEAVRAALADLPEPVREDLLDDLTEHLGEVAADLAEDGDSGPDALQRRLGDPAAYAAELWASAGLPEAPKGRSRPDLSAAAQRLRTDLSTLPGAAAVVEFLPTLRPAWWVLRGWLAVMGLSVLTSGRTGLFAGVVAPPVFGSPLLGLGLVVATVVGSVALGRRTGASTQSRTGLLIGMGNALAVVVLLFTVTQAAAAGTHRFDNVQYGPQPGQLTDPEGKQISNIYPFGPDGQRLDGVLLYDQDGRPVQVSSPHGVDRFAGEYYPEGGRVLLQFPLGTDGRPITNLYPLPAQQGYPEYGPDGNPVPQAAASAVAPPRVAVPPVVRTSPEPSPSASSTAPAPSSAPSPSPPPSGS